MFKLIYKETKDIGGYANGGREYETKKKIKLLRIQPIDDLQEQIDQFLSLGDREFVSLERD